MNPFQMKDNFLCGFNNVFTNYVHFNLVDSEFLKYFLYQGGMKFTVFWVFEDLDFKVSEGYDQNWCFPDYAQLAVSG